MIVTSKIKILFLIFLKKIRNGIFKNITTLKKSKLDLMVKKWVLWSLIHAFYYVVIINIQKMLTEKFITFKLVKMNLSKKKNQWKK